VNIEGTRNVIEAALKYQLKKLVHIGTANSFSFGSKENPGNEKSPFTGYKYGMDYIDSKKQAQDLVLDAVKDRSLNAVVLNPTFMIGPYDSKPSSGSMIIALKKGKIPGFTSGAKNYIAVKDAAVAIANSIYLGKKGECYILGNHNLSFKEAFEIMANTIGAQPPKIKLSKTMVMLYGLINSFMARLLKYKPSVTKELAKISCEEQYYCSCKARKELRMPVTPIDIAIKECYEWFTENGYVK
jgi:dihydroflavonol-4-reductase